MNIEEIKKERDKACKDYLDLYSKVDRAKDLLKILIKKEKFKIEKEDYTYIFLDHLGDLNSVLAILEERG